MLSCRIDDVVIRDMAVHPRTHDVYLSVMRGTGDDSVALIVRVDHRDGTLSDLDLSDVPCSRVSITNAPTADDERLDVELPDPPEGEELEIGGGTIRIARRPAAYVDRHRPRLCRRHRARRRHVERGVSRPTCGASRSPSRAR